jgi:uncharacterized protein YbjT (DUF2867 family)
VVSISRRAPAQLPTGAVHAAADVTTGDGLAAALAGVDVVIDGTNAQVDAHAVLVEGTQRVLEAAKAAGVRHFVGISIVGIDRAPFAYYGVKLAQEAVIEASPVPWSLLRATQFHDLISKLAPRFLGVFIAPRSWPLQPIDVREVASALVAAAEAGPAGKLPDLGGPEVVAFAELLRRWKRASATRGLVVPLPVPGARGRYLRSGAMCCPDRALGTRTFDAWLAESYPASV